MSFSLVRDERDRDIFTTGVNDRRDASWMLVVLLLLSTWVVDEAVAVEVMEKRLERRTKAIR